MHPSIKRWLDLIALTIIAIMVWVFFYPYLEKLSLRFTSYLDAWPLWIKTSMNGLLIFFLWSVLIRLGGFRFRDLFSTPSFRFPPTWFFGLIGFAAYILSLSFYHESYSNLFFCFDPKTYILFAMPIIGGIIFAGVVSSFNTVRLDLKKKNINLTKNFMDVHSIIENNVNFLEWINQEEPIRYPEEDLFGYRIIAMRIAKILIQKEIKTVGIVGSYGAGKSSLLNLISYYLINAKAKELIDQNTKTKINSFDGKILISRVDGWGRSGISVSQQILSIAIQKLSKEIDCLSVITVPARYRKALKESKGVLGTIFAALLWPDEDPVRILHRLDNILKAGSLRLIIFLEDLDRNLSDHLIRDEMPALLDRLHGLSNITFVLAIGTEQHYSDILIRICEHVENIT